MGIHKSTAEIVLKSIKVVTDFPLSHDLFPCNIWFLFLRLEEIAEGTRSPSVSNIKNTATRAL